MKIRKSLLALVSLLLVAALMFTGCSNTSKPSGESKPQGTEQPKEEPAKGQPAKQYGLATATVGGAFYPMGQAIANVVNAHYKGVVLNAEVTNGALENNRLINDEESAFAITNADLAFYAANGQKPYDKKLDVVAVGSLHPSVLHIITLADSPINSIKDLKGKRVAVGPAGGASLGAMENILKEYGMTLADIKPSYLAYTDGFTQMSDGNIDVALAMSGYPAAAVMEVTATKKIKFLEIDADIFDKMLEKYSYYTKATVPKDVYKLDKDATAIGISNLLVCKSTLDEETVYNVTKALYDNIEELKANNKTAAQIDTASIGKTSIPLHPGAKKYFDEKK